MRRAGIFLGLGQIVVWGSLFYSFPLIAEHFVGSKGWQPASVYAAATVSLLAAGFFALPVGRLIDRGYGRPLILGASVLGGLLLVFCSLVSELWQFYIVYFFMGAAMAATLYEPVFADLVRRWPVEAASKLIVRVTLWGGLASTVYVPLVVASLEGFGFLPAIAALGVSTAILGPFFHNLGMGKREPLATRALDDPARQSKPRQSKPRQSKPRREELGEGPQSSLRKILSNGVFWAITATFSLHAAISSAVGYHLFPYLREAELSLSETVLIMNALGPAQILGRLIPWWRIGGRRSWLAQAAVILLFPLSIGAAAVLPTSFATFFVLVILYGAANGTMTVLKGQAALRHLPLLPYGQTNGIMALPLTISRSMSPLFVALFVQGTEGYGLVVSLAILPAAALPFLFAAYASRRTRARTES